MMRTFFFTALALVVAGCGTRTPGGGAITTLDVEAAIDNPRVFDLAEITESVEFIPLDDSSKEALVGGSIGELQESKNGFYICEGFMTPVQHFDREGKFVSLIGRIGRGPGETSYILKMAVDYGSGNVYIDGSNRNFVACDAAGRMFARNDSVTNSYDMLFNNGRLISLISIPLRAWDNDAERVPFLDVFSNDLKHEKSIDGDNFGSGDYHFTDLRSGAFGSGSVPFMTDNGERLLVRQSRNDTVYHYDGGALNPAYFLNLGRYSLPAEGYGIDPSVEMSDKFYSVDKLWEGDRYVVVSADNYRRLPSGERIPGRRLVFDRADSSGGGFSAVGGPDGGPGLFLDGIRFVAMSVRDNRLVGVMQALEIVDGADRITRPDLKELAASLKEDSNPVIVIATLKR
jgi:hypothetical protein